MAALELAGALLLVIGAGFICTGTIGLLRFPDVYTRLHALAKVDNLGLGCIVLGLVLRAPGLAAAGKLILLWLLVLAASSVVSFLIADRAYSGGIDHWRAP